MKENVLTIPIAIIVAGALIGGAVVFSNRNNTAATPKAPEVQAVDINIRPIDTSDHIVGNPNAKVLLVEYSDTECPFCKNFHATLNGLVDTYGKEGKFTWVYRHFPLDSLHKKARTEAEATECAAELGGNTKFWEYTNLLYETTTSNDRLDAAELPKIAQAVGLDVNAFNACLASGKHKQAVEDDVQEAMANGGRGTPFSIFVLQDTASESLIELVQTINAQAGGDLMTISKDKKKITMSGALPASMLKPIFDEILK